MGSVRGMRETTERGLLSPAVKRLDLRALNLMGEARAPRAGGDRVIGSSKRGMLAQEALERGKRARLEVSRGGRLGDAMACGGVPGQSDAAHVAGLLDRLPGNTETVRSSPVRPAVSSRAATALRIASTSAGPRCSRSTPSQES